MILDVFLSWYCFYMFISMWVCWDSWFFSVCVKIVSLFSVIYGC